MNAGIRDILIISTPQDTPRFQDLLGDGHQFGMNLTYAVQPSPDGLAKAFIIGAGFIRDDTVEMVLCDNIFVGHGLKKRVKAVVENAENGKGATVFGYYVDDPAAGVDWPQLVGNYTGSASPKGYCLEGRTN